MNDGQNRLLLFFQALADANRLRIVGVLAQGSQTVEQLAGLLGLGMSTTSHHLRKLAKVGLVEAKADGHYSHYSLRTEALEGLARELLSRENLPRWTGPLNLEAFDRKVLDTYTDAEGRITAFPSQHKKFMVLVRHALKAFEPERQYSEKEVNALLKHYNEDTARLRRAMVDYGLMQREAGGRAYWLNPTPPPSE